LRYKTFTGLKKMYFEFFCSAKKPSQNNFFAVGYNDRLSFRSPKLQQLRGRHHF
jgi:hypothetical protein